MATGRNSILYVVNDLDFFLSHRLPVAKAAQDVGYDVHVATPESGNVAVINKMGFIFHPISLNRKGITPCQEMRTFIELYKLYNQLKPVLVHHVTIKPVLYGSLAAQLQGGAAIVNAISGLGYIFSTTGLKSKLILICVKLFYRLAFRHDNMVVIFQNPDDRALFLENKMLNRGRSVLIRGSGVDLQKFVPSPEPEGIPLVVLASRMLWHKGVGEFVEAACLLRKAGVNARFVLVGDSDLGNPAAVPTSQLESWNNNGMVEWWGRRNDIDKIFAHANIVCLPSYLREGVPKVLIEAAASGRPIVTTDSSGCREIVQDGVNGLLVPIHDVVALSFALRKLIEDPELRVRMGKKGREIAVAEFSVEKVVTETLAVYQELLA